MSQLQTSILPVTLEETTLVDDSTLEGQGVTPDIEVQLDRKPLAAGRDVTN